MLSNSETQKHYKNESKFNGVYLRKKLDGSGAGAFLINLDEY